MSETATTNVSPFDEDYGASAVAKPEVIEPKPEEKKPEAPAAAAPLPPAETPTIPAVDYNLYVKEKFGFDSEEVALSEIKRLKEQKVAEEKQFANEDSKRAYEYLKEGKEDDLYNLLSEKKKIEKLLSVKPEEIKYETALEIAKMDMAIKYPSLTPQQIEHRLNRQYAIPPMPKQEDAELDEEYEIRVNEWKAEKEGIENDLIIDATIAMPSLEKRKIELKLPDIQKPVEQSAGPSQEDLDKQAKIDEEFVLKVPDSVKALAGVNVTATAKYGDVELPLAIPYKPSDAEKLIVEAGTKNSMEYLSKRWFDEQGVPSPTKVADDIFWLENKAAIVNKIATEAATQAIEQYTKSRANINVSGGQQSIPSTTKSKDEQIQEGIWNL